MEMLDFFGSFVGIVNRDFCAEFSVTFVVGCLCDSGLEAAGGSSELLEHVRAKLEELLGRDGVQSEHKLCTTYEIMRVYSILCLWAWHDLLDDIAFQNKFLWCVVLSSSR